MDLRRAPFAAAVVALMAAGVSPAFADDTDWTPTRKQVAHVQEVIAPEAKDKQMQAPIQVRNQYWAGINEDGRRILFGVLVRRDLDPGDHPKEHRAAVNIVDIAAMPGFFGYGCNAMFVRFDVDNDRIERVFCGANF